MIFVGIIIGLLFGFIIIYILDDSEKEPCNHRFSVTDVNAISSFNSKMYGFVPDGVQYTLTCRHCGKEIELTEQEFERFKQEWVNTYCPKDVHPTKQEEGR